ncbi:MAG: hypothetical protein ACXWB3_07575, partial [Kaistella sp.]
ISEPSEQKKIYLKLRDLIDETYFSFYEDRLAKIEAATRVRPVYRKELSFKRSVISKHKSSDSNQDMK